MARWKSNRPAIDQSPQKVPTVVLMTEDAANRQKAEKSGITSPSGLFLALSNLFILFSFYVHHSTQVHERIYTTLDLLAAVGSEDMEPTRAAAGRQVLYPDVRFSNFLSYHRLFVYFFGLTSWLKYLPTATLLAGVKAGELHQGHFDANQYNYLEGSVQVLAFTKPVLLIGRENMNRAVNGEVVVIEVFDNTS
jgi:exosome complex exonuclease DIS3/RRP44